MFRKMRRNKQELSEEVCKEVLNKSKRGVLAVLGDGEYPYTVPINYYYCEDNNKIYFHGAREGHKIDAISKHDKVSFCVYDEGYLKDGDWALYIKSIIVFGRLHLSNEKEHDLAALRKLAEKYYPTPDSVEEIMNKEAHLAQVLELDIEHMSGKLVHEC